MSAMRNLRYAAVCGLLMLGGCRLPSSSADGQTGARETPSAGAAASPSAAAAPATEIQVNKSYWHKGFKVTLGAAKIVEGSYSPKVVTLAATFQNLSAEHERSPTAYALLTAGSQTYSEVDSPLTKLPEVPAQRSQPGAYAFVVDDSFVLADAVLIVGEAGVRQATMPLGRDAGLVALEPKPVDVTGKVTREKSGAVFMSVLNGEVRADDPLLHGEAPTGFEFLRIAFNATNNGNGGFAWVFDRDLTLKLPDGTSVATADNCSRAQILPNPHSTAFGGLACFLVPTPAGGTYTLVWDTYAKGALKITV
jgi:hypothetical protein